MNTYRIDAMVLVAVPEASSLYFAVTTCSCVGAFFLWRRRRGPVKSAESANKYFCYQKY
jgi:hypothetical protein